MDIFDQRKLLESFRILIDTREQPTRRARKRYESFGCPFERVTLNYGDYAYNAVLPSGEPIFNTLETVSPMCAVERKMDLDELAQCFTRSRKRFEREFQRATDHKARIFLIVENGSWENLVNGKYRSRFNPKAFLASVSAFTIRYNMCLQFCKEETSGTIIKEFLYRDLKERLERGEFG